MAPLCSEVDRHFESVRKDILAHKTAAFRCCAECAAAAFNFALNKSGYCKREGTV